MPLSSNELIRDAMSETIIQTVENMVMENGAHGITVRKVLAVLNISNRVFYNRFRNIEEVLEIVYKNTIIKVRESLTVTLDSEKDFFENVMDIVIRTLLVSYDTKMQFNQYIFENDSHSQSNYTWWMSEIKKLIDFAKEKKFIKDVDSEVMSYAIWCFCRGYNADAVARNLPREEAVRRFRYSFSYLLDGLKAN